MLEKMNMEVDKLKIISIVNFKGGSGKTATVLNLSSALGQKGFRVLVIDAHSLNHITSLMLPQHFHNNSKTLFDALNGTSIDGCIYESISKNVDIIPLGEGLETINYDLSEYIDIKVKLCDIVNSTTIQKYDYVLIDTGSNTDFMMKMALMISNSLLIPIRSFMSLNSLQRVAEYITAIKVNLNTDLDCGYVFLAFQDRRTKIGKSLSEFKQTFGDRALLTEIPETTIIGNSMDENQSVIYYNPKCNGSLAYKQLADEIIEKFAKDNNIDERMDYEVILERYATAGDKFSEYFMAKYSKKSCKMP
jgi:chromosome partitioning protein